MTDLKKSLGMTIFAVFALAFCCLLIGQAAVAKIGDNSKVAVKDIISVSEVPLPTPEEAIQLTPGMPGPGMEQINGANSENAEGTPTIVTGGKPSAYALGKNVKDASAANGRKTSAQAAMVNNTNETPALATVIGAVPFTENGEFFGPIGTREAAPTCAGGASQGDLWWSYTPAANGYVNVTMCNTDDVYKDFYLAIWDGPGTTEMACDDDGCVAPDYGAPTIAQFLALVGHTYYIQMGHYAGAVGDGLFRLDVEVATDPFADAAAAADFTESVETCATHGLNDGCYLAPADYAAAENIGVLGAGSYILAGTTYRTGAPATRTFGAAGNSDADQWRFTMSTIGKVYIDIYAEIAVGTFIHTYGAVPACGAGQGLVTGTNIGTTAGYVHIQYSTVLYTGTNYTFSLRPADENMDCTGNPFGGAPRYFYTITVEPLTPVDDCGLATEISGNGTWNQDLAGFTADGPFTPYGSPYAYFQNGWWRWHCLTTGTVTVSTCNTPACGPTLPDESADLMLGIFPDGCPPTTAIAFNDDGAACPGYESEATFIAVAGTYYLITVGNWPWTPCDPVVQLDISTVPLTAQNDLCANKTPLHIGRNFVHNLDATLDGPLANVCDPAGETCADVWYTYTATATGFAQFDMCSGTLASGGVSGNPAHSWDSKIMVYQGSECLAEVPRDAMPIGCSDDGCGWYGDGGLAEVPVVAGQSFLIRVAGWFNATNPCGMGFGYMQISETLASIRPPKTFCENVVPVPLTAGVTTSITGNYNWSSWGSCPGAYANGWQNFPWANWEAVNFPVCGNLTIDFCGTPESSGRVTFTSMPGSTFLFTGCICAGDFVALPAFGTFIGISNCPVPPYTTADDLNRAWYFHSLIPGDYYFPVSSYELGINTQANGSYNPAHGYQVNFLATEGECIICAATANINSCPPVAGATWLINVDISGLHKVGIPGYTVAANDCHGYEDHTALTGGKVYRGMNYTLTASYGRNGHTALGVLDSADVWVDWNQNSGLAANASEASERTRLVRAGETVTGTISVPIDAVLPGGGATGTTLMRVRLANAADGSNAPCGDKTWGEVEDYFLVVANLECGDFDISGSIGVEDITFLRNYYFGAGPAPDYWQRGDIDGDGAITIADIIALADAAYRGGALNCM